ncbi:MAG: mucoidy inhibitor MuiA family protein [Bacteroidetes bacterium]|nr:mucoidy inhibitor MuiA family protein [Bacteroidota bacterium]
MKMLLTLLFSISIISAIAQELHQEVSSKVKQVTVFLNGAQITRQATIPIAAGVTLLKFKNLAPRIQEQSIQAEGTNGIRILSVSFQVNHIEENRKPEKIASLEAERKRLNSLLKQEQSQEEVYKEEEIILKTNKSIGGTSKGVEIEQLKVAMDYFRQRLIDIKQHLFEIDRNIRKLNEELNKVEAQLREQSVSKEQSSGEITVKVSSKVATQSNVLLKYLVNEAKWFPSYDIRAKNVESPVAITYKANVSQQSGEDWENVELTISSADPSVGGERPSLKTWVLGFNNSYGGFNNSYGGSTPIRIRGISTIGSNSNSFVQGSVRSAEDGSSLPGVNVMIKGSTIGTVSDAGGNYFLALPSDASTLVFSFIGLKTEEVAIAGRRQVDASLSLDVTQLSEVVVTAQGVEKEKKSVGYAVSTIQWDDSHDYHYTPRVTKTLVATPIVKQTNFEFTIDEPFSIKSDGEVRATDMIEYELPALYEYFCVPKLDPDAFLVAKVLGWDEYNFLDGEASLFFEGKFIGKSVLDTRHASDTLTLSLGRDANVLVKREKVKELTSRQTVGSNQKAMYAFDISVRNKKANSISIVIEDQIPVPNTKEIDIDKMEDSKAAYNEETGLLKWRKTIKPGTTETIKLRYSVKFSKGSNILLE